MPQITLAFDASEAITQADELASLLERLPDRFRGKLARMDESLLLDVSLGEPVTTPGAGDLDHVIYRLKFGGRFERLVAALRADKWDDAVHIVRDLCPAA